jgi:hypothetical protein
MDKKDAKELLEFVVESIQDELESLVNSIIRQEYSAS